MLMSVGGSRKNRRCGQLVILVTVILVMCNHTFTSPSSRDRSRSILRARLPQFGEMLAGWLHSAVIVDLLAYGTLQEAILLPSATPDSVHSHYVKR